MKRKLISDLMFLFTMWLCSVAILGSIAVLIFKIVKQ